MESLLLGVVSIFFPLLIWTIKTGLKNFMTGLEKTNDKIENLTSEVHELNMTLTAHKSDIKSNADANVDQDKRLNAHGERIRKLEIEFARKK